MAERSCKKCFHYKACKEIASHNGYNDIRYTESECKYFLSTAKVAPKNEIAKKIFKAIEEVLRAHTEGGYYLNGAWFPERLDVYTKDAIAKLKKKYMEGE